MKRIAFATCVKLGLSCIEEIYKIDGKLDLIITLNDDIAKAKSGRVYLDKVSEQKNIPLLKIKNINDIEVLNAIEKYSIDWLFIIGWSQIAKKPVLDKPKMGCVGMHPTLLPKGRGRAAIPWAIIKGLNKTGVTFFKLDEGVDTGKIIGQETILLSNTTTATELYDEVNLAHMKLISKYWNDLINDKVDLKAQDENDATYWEGRSPEDGEIFNTMTIIEADRLVRAVTKPYPGAFYKYPDKQIRIWSAKTDKKNGEIRLKDGYLTPVNYEIEEL